MKNRKKIKLGLITLLMILSGGQLLSCKNKNNEHSINFPSTSSLESISYNSPDIVPNVIDIDESMGRSFTLNDGEFHWYKFVATETRTYYICSSGGSDIIIDLFENVVNGYSDEHLIKSYQGGFIAKPLVVNSLEMSFGCYFSIVLNANQIIYFRIRNGNYKSCERGNVFVGKEPFPFAEELRK